MLKLSLEHTLKSNPCTLDPKTLNPKTLNPTPRPGSKILSPDDFRARRKRIYFPAGIRNQITQRLFPTQASLGAL